LLLAETPRLNGPALTFSKDRIEVGSSADAGNADVWLVHYDPRVEAVAIARGENGGATLQHTHVVRRLDRLGTWNGSKASFLLPCSDAGLKTAVLIQRPSGGPILSAVTD